MTDPISPSPNTDPNDIAFTLYAWHLHDLLRHHPPHQWYHWIHNTAAGAELRTILDPHARPRALERAIWATASDPRAQRHWSQLFRERLTQAFPYDPPSWKQWLWHNPDDFPLLWQASLARWRIPVTPGVDRWWRTHIPAITQALTLERLTHPNTAWAKLPAVSAGTTPIVPMQQLQKTLQVVTHQRDIAYQNLQTIQTHRDCDTSEASEASEDSESPDAPRLDTQDLLKTWRFDVVGLYRRRQAYHHVIESLGGTIGHFWEGMDDQVPRRLGVDAVIIDYTHVHHSTIHRIIQPREKIVLGNPSPQALYHTLVQWGMQHIPPSGGLTPP